MMTPKIKFFHRKNIKMALFGALLVSLTPGSFTPSSLFSAETLPKPWLKISSHTLLSGARDFTPQPSQELTFHHPLMTIRVYARKFIPGEPAYIEVIPKEGENLDHYQFSFHEIEILLTRYDWGYRGFFPISPYLNDQIKKTKDYMLEVTPPGHLAHLEKKYPLSIYKANFFTSRTTLNVGKYARSEKTRQELRQIEEGRKKKSQAYATLTSNMINNKISHPRDFHYITSPFWSKRIYARYKKKGGKKIYQKPRVSIHQGLDFRAPEGAPIYAIASGRVVLAEKLYYEGNCVIVNHGNAIFSVYSHMSELKVYQHQYVRAGRLLGLSGETGQVTGPHLHLALYINGVPVNPLGFLSLPIRN